MNTVNATELARQLNVSKARVSQYVAEGKLDGCFTGEKGARRFDLTAVLQRLNRTLDAGQMLGNGATTKKAIRALMVEGVDLDGDDAPAAAVPKSVVAKTDGSLPEGGTDHYEMARTLKVQQEARRLLMENELRNGTLVVASEAARQAQRMLGQEIAQFEQFLREAARQQADKLGHDYKALRQVLMQAWRSHRAARTEQLQAEAEVASLTEAETEAQI
jgi:hypothetical protein